MNGFMNHNRLTVPLPVERGDPIVVVFPGEVLDRLANTCFRGRDSPLAGNFCRFDTADELLADPEFAGQLAEQIRRIVRDADDGNRRGISARLTIYFDKAVGWASTALKTEFDLETETDEYCPNEYTVVRRVKRSLADEHPAPATFDITLSVWLTESAKGWRCTVHSIYPGPDIGPLSPPKHMRGGPPLDITKTEHMVMFDWNHPGKPISTR